MLSLKRSYHPTMDTNNCFHVSTMTATASINSGFCLKEIFNCLNPVVHEPDKRAVMYLEYGENKYDKQTKGDKPNNGKSSKKKHNDNNNQEVARASRFDNQSTIIFTVNRSNVNMKLFKNGNIQMTGLKTTSDGKECIDYLLSILKPFKEKCFENIGGDEFVVKSYNTVLINSNFTFPFQMKGKELYMLFRDKYGMDISYEQEIYPGVKLKFYYNEDKDGKCKCEKQCIHKGKNNRCDRITVVFFQSGCTNITGAKTIEQVQFVYEFVSKIVNDNRDALQKAAPSVSVMARRKLIRNEIKIKRSQLIVAP